MGGEESARGRHSGGVPLLKTRGVAGIVSFVRKWKFHLSLSFSALWTVVTPVSFCCSQDRDCWSCLRQRNAYQLESLFVCLFLFDFLLLQRNNSNIIIVTIFSSTDVICTLNYLLGGGRVWCMASPCAVVVTGFVQKLKIICQPLPNYTTNHPTTRPPYKIFQEKNRHCQPAL